MKKLDINFIIETERLIIEMPKLEDAEEMYNLIDDDITRYMVWDKGESYAITETNIVKGIKNVQDGKSWEALIRDKNTKEIVGRCGIVRYDRENIKSVEVGYWLAKKYWGKGYMPEAVESIKKLAFDQYDWNRIIMIIIKENNNSRRVAEKCGFHLDGIIRKNHLMKGKIVDEAIYTFLREEYKK